MRHYPMRFLEGSASQPPALWLSPALGGIWKHLVVV